MKTQVADTVIEYVPPEIPQAEGFLGEPYFYYFKIGGRRCVYNTTEQILHPTVYPDKWGMDRNSGPCPAEHQQLAESFIRLLS